MDFKDKNKNNVDDRLDFLVNVCAVVLPFTTIPQLYTIFIERKAEGISIVTWILYAVLNIPLFIYSIKRKEIPMIILNGLWVIFDTLVAVGAILVTRF